MTKRTVPNIRVCLEDRQNLMEQLNVRREHAHELDWNIVKESAEQGPGTSSPDLCQMNYMLELAQAGELEVLVANDPYRLSREWTSLQPLAGGQT